MISSLAESGAAERQAEPDAIRRQSDPQASDQQTAVAILLAAGTGSRMQLPKGASKQMLALAGEPVFLRSWRVLAQHPEVKGIVLVAGESFDQAMNAWIQSHIPADLRVKAYATVSGGPERQDSVANALAWLREHMSADSRRPVLIHDAARCLVDLATISRVLAGVARSGACAAAVPVKDTIKEIKPDETDTAFPAVQQTLQRDRLYALQTPQGARLDWLLTAHARAEREQIYATDDLALLEWAGYPTVLCRGDYRNIKITTPEDIVIAEALLR